MYSIYNLKTLYKKMNGDPEDTWLAAGAGISITLLAICICISAIREWRRPRIKESRSDGDLANMLEQGEST
jgi:hypothetical protein